MQACIWPVLAIPAQGLYAHTQILVPSQGIAGRYMAGPGHTRSGPEYRVCAHIGYAGLYTVYAHTLCTGLYTGM